MGKDKNPEQKQPEEQAAAPEASSVIVETANDTVQAVNGQTGRSVVNPTLPAEIRKQIEEMVNEAVRQNKQTVTLSDEQVELLARAARQAGLGPEVDQIFGQKTGLDTRPLYKRVGEYRPKAKHLALVVVGVGGIVLLWEGISYVFDLPSLFRSKKQEEIII
jgi:hypothetical protein